MSSMREGFWYDSAGRVLLIRQRAADDSVLVVAQIDGHDMSHPTWFNPGDVPPMGWSLIRPLEAQPGAPDEAKRLASELARRWLQPRLNMLHRLRGRDSMTPEEIAKARAVGRTWRSATRQLCEAFGIPEPAVPADDPSADYARELLASEADALGLAEVARSAVIFGKSKAAGFYASCDRCGASPPGSVWCVARQAQINERCPKCGAVGVADDEEELQRWRIMSSRAGQDRIAEASARQAAQHPGGVTITAPDGMTLGEVWEALKARPGLRVCLDAELRREREEARALPPEAVQKARCDVQTDVLEDAFRAGVEEGQRRAREKARSSLLDLANEWEREATRRRTGVREAAARTLNPDITSPATLASADALDRAAADLRSALCPAPDAPPTSNVGVDSAGGGVPHEVDARHPADCEWCDLSVTGTSPVAPQDGSAEIHDPRWQPGAVWEHRSVDVARFEIVRGEPDADGRIFLRGPWGDVLAKPAALSEANGWRFVGDEK